jgi:tagaturonate reductase
MKLSLNWLDTKGLPNSNDLPERILQFGEGNFLRGFVDWMIHQLNQKSTHRIGRIVVVNPRVNGAKHLPSFQEQDNLYTVWKRGIQNGTEFESKEIITSISRVINPYSNWQDFLSCASNPSIDIVVSNTTEAGLTYFEEPYQIETCPLSYPGKLTAYLYERYKIFHGDPTMGIDIVPCELIEDNGDRLRELVLQYVVVWRLPDGFRNWIIQHNYFYNTLVDRIVTGFSTVNPDVIKLEFPYEDSLGVICEPFHLWIIQGPNRLQKKWNFNETGLNVRYVEDVAPFRLTKVRVLNGAHTALAGISFLAGIRTVGEAVNHEILGQFIRQLINKEILPALMLNGISEQEANEFANSVLERFMNPFLHHEIISLQLNALSKIRVRLLPTLLDYFNHYQMLPSLLVMAITAQLLYYRNSDNPASPWQIQDNGLHMRLLEEGWALEKSSGLEFSIQQILSLQEIWGSDLNNINGLAKRIAENILKLRELGFMDSLLKIINELE